MERRTTSAMPTAIAARTDLAAMAGDADFKQVEMTRALEEFKPLLD